MVVNKNIKGQPAVCKSFYLYLLEDGHYLYKDKFVTGTVRVTYFMYLKNGLLLKKSQLAQELKSDFRTVLNQIKLKL